MRAFKVDVCPFETGKRLYYSSYVTFDPGLTVLVGCNGSGKSTLLGILESELKYNSKDKDILCIMYDDRGLEGSANLVSKFGFQERFDEMASVMSESEGERIMHGLCDVAGQIGHKIHSSRKQGKIFKEVWILFDAVGSGLSIDGINSIKKDLVNTVIEDCKGTDVYFIVSTNEYEFARGEDCIDVTTFNHIKFDDYEAYRKYILRTRVKKNKREDKWYGR